MLACSICGKVLDYQTMTVDSDSKTETVTIVKVAKCCDETYQLVYELDDKKYDIGGEG